MLTGRRTTRPSACCAGFIAEQQPDTSVDSQASETRREQERVDLEAAFCSLAGHSFAAGSANAGIRGAPPGGRSDQAPERRRWQVSADRRNRGYAPSGAPLSSHVELIVALLFAEEALAGKPQSNLVRAEGLTRLAGMQGR